MLDVATASSRDYTNCLHFCLVASDSCMSFLFDMVFTRRTMDSRRALNFLLRIFAFLAASFYLLLLYLFSGGAGLLLPLTVMGGLGEKKCKFLRLILLTMARVGIGLVLSIFFPLLFSSTAYIGRSFLSDCYRSSSMLVFDIGSLKTWIVLYFFYPEVMDTNHAFRRVWRFRRLLEYVYTHGHGV